VNVACINPPNCPKGGTTVVSLIGVGFTVQAKVWFGRKLKESAVKSSKLIEFYLYSEDTAFEGSCPIYVIDGVKGNREISDFFEFVVTP